MTDPLTSESTDELRRRRNAVNRAVAELRRGLPVLVRATDGPPTAVLAAETATSDMLARIVDWNRAATRIAVTSRRARALNVPPSGHDIVLIPWRRWFDVETVRDIGDASADLAHPLRGPFEREKRPPTLAESAGVQLAKLARLLPVAVIVPIETAAPVAWAAANDLLCVEAAHIAAYEDDSAVALRQVTRARVALSEASEALLVAFRPGDGSIEHLALVIGRPSPRQPVLTRLHSECFTGDLLGSLKCDCGEQLRGAIARMAEEGAGILLYLAQEGRGIGLMNKLRAYRLQEDGFDTIDANLRLGFDADERVFQPAAEMLRQLGYARVRLLSNNPDKVAGLASAGIEVVERVPHNFPANTHNELYLRTKRQRGGHLA